MAQAKKKAKKVTKKVAKKKVTKKVAKKAVTKKKVTKKVAKKAAAKKKVAKKTTSKKKVAKKAATKKTASKKTAASKSKPAHTAVTRRRNATETPGVKPYEAAHDEEYMSDDQLEHFRNILQEWKLQLMEEVDRTVHHMQDDAANFPDPNDRATQESEFSLELRARDRERKLIKKINESLEMIDSGEYGYCEACGVEIGIRRLEARPTATQCIDCKTLDEIKEKQRA